MTLEPCALDAEFHHFMLRFNKKNFLTLQVLLKEGTRGERRPKRQGEDRVTLGITLLTSWSQRP